MQNDDRYAQIVHELEVAVRTVFARFGNSDEEVYLVRLALSEMQAPRREGNRVGRLAAEVVGG